MLIRKRNGTEVKFDSEKIVNAITRANESLINKSDRLTKTKINDICKKITSIVKNKSTVSTVEEVQDLVESELIHADKPALAKSYITYRYMHSINRPNGNTPLFDQVESLLNGQNQEVIADNANKSPTHHNVARDYIAGFVCKEIAKMKLPSDIMDAHREGLLHYHDLDYAPAMAEHNCFRGDTKFVTEYGLRTFDSFKDGDKVTVLDMDGIPRLATVHNYGKQKLQKVILGQRNGTPNVELYCTANHRWILQDDSVTTELKVGDYLRGWNQLNRFNPYNCNKDELSYWTLGFCLGDGTEYNHLGGGIQLRLCGDKVKYEDLFISDGFYHRNSEFLYKLGVSKDNFINNKEWKTLPYNLKRALFSGYYAADGNSDGSRITTVNENLYELILDLADFAGYYIYRNYKYENRPTNFGPANDYWVHFSKSEFPSINYGWRVINIEELDIEEDVWCVTEPITHSFMLEKGIVTGNCDLLDINDMLQNGTLMGGTLIHKPHSLATAMTVTTQISMNAASSQYGGQTITLAHLAPFVDVSRKRIRKELLEDLPDLPKDKLNKMVEKRLRKEVNGAVQTLQYQEITCACSNGQSPFITIFMYLDEVPAGRLRNDLALLIEETLKQRIQGIQAPDGSWVAPVFPKLIYVLDEDNIHPKSKYYYLTELARDCTMKRMVPDYVSAKVMKKLRGEVFSSMGCRSQLSVLYPKNKPECILEYGTKENGHEGQVLTVDRKWRDPNKAVFYGRFNLGVCTINLPDVALTALEECKIPRESIGNTNYLGNTKVIDKFNEVLRDRLELCHRALRTRYERLRGTSSNVAPILWQGGALARLGSNETIDNLLVNGWATISLGYAGLFETVKAITGESHTSPEGADFAMYIMETLHDICDVWRESEPEHLGYSLYGTPEEFLTDKLAKSLQRRHGIIKGVTDKLYVTNSYHVPVFEEIDAFSKLSKEAPFQDLSSGGNISYIELPSMNKNPDALMSVIKHIYETNIYAEVNTKLDHCYKCGYDGEVELLSNDYGRYKLRCPNCGNEDARTMYVIRRLCGYIGRIDSKDNPINSNPSSSEGRLSEIHDRVCHL